MSCSSQVTLFRCISLWLYHGILPCPRLSAKPAYAISSHHCHRNVSLPSGASLWNGMFGLVEGQYTAQRVFSHVVCFFLSVFWRNFCFFMKLKKISPKRCNKPENVCLAYTFLWRLTAVSWNEIVFSLEVTLKRVCWSFKGKCEKVRDCWKISVFIENTCHGVGSKNAGRNWSADIVLGTDHLVLLANGFPRLIVYVRPPSLFWEQVA